MSPEKREMIRKQVFSKVHWGTEEEEVMKFLSEKGIPDEDAEQMYNEAWRDKAALIRRQATMMIVISSIGTLIGGVIAAYTYLLTMEIRKMTIVGLVIAVPSVICLAKTFVKLQSGKYEGPAE
jgi:hypothetical protein